MALYIAASPGSRHAQKLMAKSFVNMFVCLYVLSSSSEMVVDTFVYITHHFRNTSFIILGRD